MSDLSLKKQREASEREAIFTALERVGGNRQMAAAALGISVRSLYHKIALYGLNKNKSKGETNHADENE